MSKNGRSIQRQDVKEGDVLVFHLQSECIDSSTSSSSPSKRQGMHKEDEQGGYSWTTNGLVELVRNGGSIGRVTNKQSSSKQCIVLSFLKENASSLDDMRSLEADQRYSPQSSLLYAVACPRTSIRST